MRKQFKSTMIFLGVAAIVWFIQVIAKFFPAIVDLIYTRGIFQFVRFVFDYTTGLLPFPTVYLLFFWLLYTLIQLIRAIFQKKLELGAAIMKLLKFLAIAYSLFYLLWGFNYKQTPIEFQMELPQLTMDSSDLRQEFQKATADLKQVVHDIENEGWTLDQLIEMEWSESEIRLNLESVLKTFDFPTGGRTRGRLLKPNGTLLIWNTAGIYIPFVGEGHVDDGLLSFQKPFTMAHEMSHAYGITDEGSCNFTGFLACREAEDLFIRFSGYFGYWRYVASEYRLLDEEAYADEFKQLPNLIVEALKAIYTNNDKYPELMPKMRYKIYDEYLKAQGIAEGHRNYSRVVKLVDAWRKVKN